MKHRTVVVHEGLTYIVILEFQFREGILAVTVSEVIRVAPFNLNLKAS